VHVVNAVYYVAVDNANPVAPYTSWATAATNIQDAVDAAAVPGALVLVTNGLYASVATSEPLTVRSVNGPLLTTIIGGQSNRCVYLASGASLSGFTLTNGHAAYGGGVFCESTTAVSNCVAAGNSAYSGGGGAYGGALNNCTLSGNSAPQGGGAAYSTLNNCTLSSNSANSYGGGGALDCTLNNCTLYGNGAPYGGYGGGANGSILNNCALAGNSAVNGGGVYACMLNNCTVSGNSAYLGGGVFACTVNNCIVHFNTAPQGSNTILIITTTALKTIAAPPRNPPMVSATFRWTRDWPVPPI